MLKYRNFGKKSLNEIKEKLEALGLSLGMKFDERLLDTKKEIEAAGIHRIMLQYRTPPQREDLQFIAEEILPKV